VCQQAITIQAMVLQPALLLRLSFLHNYCNIVGQNLAEFNI
jgi:hypothetical protein